MDWKFRNLLGSGEWKLSPVAFSKIQLILEPLKVDLFASRLDHQLSQYISWRPDPGAMTTDAFQTPWASLQGYAFPPFVLLGRVLAKVRKGQEAIVLVTPLWQAESWYPILLNMLIDNPRGIRSFRDLLQDPQGDLDPLVQQGSLQLVAWKISGRSWLVRDFQKRLPRLF